MMYLHGLPLSLFFDFCSDNGLLCSLMEMDIGWVSKCLKRVEKIVMLINF